MADGTETTDTSALPVDATDYSGFNQWLADWKKKKENKGKQITKSLLASLFQDYKKDLQSKQSKQQGEEQNAPLSPTEETQYIGELIGSEGQTSAYVTSQQTGIPQRKVLATQGNITAGAEVAASSARKVEGGSEFAYYSGQKLVDKNGNIARDPYSGTGDAEMVFRMEALNGTLKSFLSTLQAHGYYGDGKPSSLAMSGNGFENADFNAIGTYLDQANRKGLTYDAYLPIVEASAGTYGGGGGGGSYTSKEDLAVYLRNAGFKYLGRPMTKQEIDSAARRIQQEQMSRTSSSGGEETTSLTTAAMTAAQSAAPEEFAAYSLGAALDRIYARLGGQ
jgi:hypothetical protein